MSNNKQQAEEILKSRGYSDNQIKAYRILRERGYQHSEIMNRMGKTATGQLTNMITKKPPMGAGRSFATSFLEEMLTKENIYGTAGGIAGGVIGGPIGAVAGAGIGGAVSKAEELIPEPKMILDYLNDMESQGIRPSSKGKESWKEILRESGMAGLRQSAYEAIGFGLTKGVTKGIVNPILRRIMGPVTEKGTIAIRTLAPYTAKRGIYPVLPAEATQGWFSDLAQNIAEGSFLGGRRIADFYRTSRQEAVDEMIDVVTRKVGDIASADEIGEMFAKSVRGQIDARRIATEPLWKQVDELMTGKMLDVTSIKAKAMPHAVLLEETVGEAPTLFQEIISKTMKKADIMSWQAVQTWKSNLARNIRELKLVVGKDDKSRWIAKEIMEELQSVLDKATTEAGPEASNAWKLANQTYKEMSEEINSKFIRRLVTSAQDKPEGIVKSLFQPNARPRIRQVKKLMGATSKEWGMMKRWYLEDVIRRSSQEGVLNGSMMYERLIGRQSLEKETLKEIYTEPELKSLMDVATSLKLIGEKQGKGTGRLFIQMKQAGASVDIMGAGLATGFGLGFRSPAVLYSAGAIMIGPDILSRMFTNPKSAKILVEGFRIPRRSPHFAAAMTRIVAAAENTRRKMAEERKAETKTKNIFEIPKPKEEKKEAATMGR